MADPSASPAEPQVAPEAPADSSGSPPEGSGAESPPASPESPNIRQLREQYESLKSQYEPYSKLGKPDEVSQHVTISQKLTDEAVKVGTGLGYEQSEIMDALANDPAGTVAFLRQKQAEAQASDEPPDISKTIQQELDKRLNPIMERENRRLTDEANNRFDNAFDQQIKALFKDTNLAQEERDAIYNMTSDMFAYDADAMKRLKFEGKTSDVAKYVEAARSNLEKYFVARSQREQKRIGGVQPGQGQPPRQEKKPLTLDDMAAGYFPESLGKYAT